MVRLYLIRHGIRHDAEVPSWRETAKRPKDTPLSDRGIQQAKEVATFLKDKEITHIYSSPYLRTLQTAQHIANNLPSPLEISIEPGIREWVKSTLPEPVYIPLLEAKELFPALRSNYQSPFLCSTTPETAEQIHDRCRRFVNNFTSRLVEQHDLSSSFSVALISHAATIIALIRALLGNEQFNVSVGTCSITVFELNIDGKTPTWKLLTCASTDHLSEGIQCAWGFKHS